MEELIIFNWHEFEETIKNQNNLKFPVDTQFEQGNIDISKAKNFKSISLSIGKTISNDELKELRESGSETLLLRSAGYNMLDTEYAKSIGFKVFRVANYSPESIAEFALTLILILSRRIPLQNRLHAEQNNNITLESMGLCLRNKVLGLHGYGRIARELADIARDGLKMRIQFFDPYVSNATDKKISTLEELYSTSDIVSIHVPLNQETQNTVNSTLLALVKQDFILVNTARGLIVNTEDLLLELQKGRIYYGCDVWREHDDFDPELISDRTIQTNHIAFFTQEAVLAIILQTLESYNGNPRQENIL